MFLKSKSRLIWAIGIGFIGLFIINSCSPSFSKVMQKGEVAKHDFFKSVSYEKIRGLIIVPVEINGKTYRFLFDTGATTSISKELDAELDKKTIFRGGLIDSDKNKTMVKYVSIDSLLVGEIPFYNQSAFVADFNKNPILKCMNLDGILGSNTMKNCNWKIDDHAQLLHLTNHSIDSSNKYIIPFKTNSQFDLKVDLKTHDLSITNLKIDYGSNGALSIPKSVISTLHEKEVMTKITAHKGFSQSGITGKVTKIDELVGELDSLYFNNLVFKDISVRTGSGLIGTKILSNWIVEIDWTHHLLCLTPQKERNTDLETYGMHINFSEKRGAYIQSVIENSEADQKGISPEMSVVRLNDLALTDENDFCKYLYQDQKQDTLNMELINLNGDTLMMTLYKSLIDYNNN